MAAAETQLTPSQFPPMQNIIELTKLAHERGDPPLLWAVDTANCLRDAGLEIPSVELGHILAGYACGKGSRPAVWSYLDHAMAAHLVSSLHVLALLTPRVIRNRRQHPEMYMLYMDLMSTHIFSLGSTKRFPYCERVIKSVDETLQLSLPSSMPILDFGMAVVQFLFTVICRLVDATCEDWGLPPNWPDKRSKVGGGASQNLQSHALQDIGMELEEELEEKRREELEQLRKNNSLAAFELVAKVMQNKRTAALFGLARRHLSEQWKKLTQRLQLLEAFTQDASLSAPKGALEAFRLLVGSMQQGLFQEWRPSQLPIVRALLETSSHNSSVGNCSGVGRAAPWLPFDIFMEDAMDWRQVPATSMVETLAELVKSWQAVQNASWHDTFLALWISALRLVQRERESVEGPKPHIESRLCMLLSVVPLASALVIEEEEKPLIAATNGSEASCIGTGKNQERSGIRRAALISSLQILGQFEGLLSPPQIVAAAAYQAAAAAAAFVAGINGGSGGMEGMGGTDGNAGSKTAGNLRHLIVETCLARGLIDTSAYFWPGYMGTTGLLNPLVSSQSSPWSAFMDGAPLSAPLKSSLLATPAGSLAELEKIYQVAVSGPEEEQAVAASILCGASLIRGWNVQEHAVRFVVRLLSPPPPADYRGSSSHLVSYAPMLQAVLGSLTSEDAVHVMSLYGLFPELAAALMPICEVFGSISPAVPLTTNSGEDVSVFTVFSLAFLLLIRLWKFHHPPAEHRLLEIGAPLGSDLSLDYLLLRHNVLVASTMGSSFENNSKDDQLPAIKRMQTLGSNFYHVTKGPTQQLLRQVTLDVFPKFRAWYLQHQTCISSSLSDLARGDPVHQVGDRILKMMMRKMGKCGSVPNTPGASGSSSGGDDEGGKPLLPAWDLLAAVPFVMDALLPACAHGKLSPRDLTTGLKDLVDFLPASLVTIISYLSAEVTCGLWKPASMNGTDWPSPSANLLSVEAEIKDLLAATGVNLPSMVTGSVSGNSPASLPLPLAALVSLTITYKVEKLTEAVLAVACPALGSTAGGSPWPSMPIVAALWAQKVRRWHDFIVFASAHTVFRQDKNAVVQLLHSCFMATLGSTNTSNSRLTVHGGVGALLGHGHWSCVAPGGRHHPVAPGIMYLRICPSLHDVIFLSEEILTLLVQVARDFAFVAAEAETSSIMLKHGSRVRSVYPSLATILARVLQASTLGASLLCVSGGAPLVELLYTETLPTWFVSGSRNRDKSIDVKRGSSGLLEGYAMAYFALLSGVLAWGVSQLKVAQGAGSSLSTQRRRALCTHMTFIVSVLDGRVSLGCEQATWKAFVVGFVAMIVTCTPGWILDIKIETLRRLAVELRLWHENDLAVALLERGGPAAMSTTAELILGC